MRYLITHHRPDGADPDRRIDRLKGPQWEGTVDSMLTWLDMGHQFYTSVRGMTVDIIPKIGPLGRRYVATRPDYYPNNNLLWLPTY